MMMALECTVVAGEDYPIRWAMLAHRLLPVRRIVGTCPRDMTAYMHRRWPRIGHLDSEGLEVVHRETRHHLDVRFEPRCE